MTEDLEELADEIARKEAQRWRDLSIEALLQAGRRKGWNVESIANSFSDVYRSGNGWAFEVQSDYASIMEYGTSPHTIRPDTAEVLRFEVDGEEVFAKEVKHPGTPALLYVQTAKTRLMTRQPNY